MIVGVLRLTLQIPGASSLKDKRQVLRKIVDRLRARYNVSVAEVGDNDVHRRAVVGVTCVANDHAFVNEVLDKCVRDAENVTPVLNREMEIETYSEMKADWTEKPDLDFHDLSDAGAPEADDEAGPELEGWLKEEDL